MVPIEEMVFSWKGLKIPLVSHKQTLLSHIDRSWTDEKCGHYLVAVNPEKVCRAQKDTDLQNTLKQASANYADGIGIVWAIRFLLGQPIDRIPGIDLFEEILQRLADRQGSVYLFGATEDSNRLAAEVIAGRWPTLAVVGRRHGFDVPWDSLREEINALSPDLVAVALGSPAQEKWISANAPLLKAKLLMGVGGSFDVISGQKRRAPQWLRKGGLEWAYRLLLDPRRIGRYIALPRFASGVIRQKWSS